MNKYKKGFAHVIFIAIGVLVLVGAVGTTVAVVNKKYGPKEETPAVSDSAASEKKGEMKDWKTYRNEKYGFEFKYPTDAIVTMNTYRQAPPPPGQDRFVVEFPEIKSDGPPGHQLFLFNVQPTEIKDGNELINKERSEIQNNPNVRNRWEVTQDNFFNLGKAIVIKDNPKNGEYALGCSPTGTLTLRVLFVKSGYLFSFDDYRCEGYPKIVSEVMNTFKFTN